MAFNALFFGKSGMIAVYGRTGRVHKFLYAVLSRCFHHVQRADNVILRIENRHFDASGNAAPCRLIQHIIHTLAGFHTGIQIFDVAFDKGIVRITFKHLHMLRIACGKVVQTSYLITEVQDRLAQVGTDKTGAACYQKYTVLVKFQILISHGFPLISAAAAALYFIHDNRMLAERAFYYFG